MATRPNFADPFARGASAAKSIERSAADYFADGMTDELITELAQVGNLRVISRTSSMSYKSTKKTLPEIARELNVDAVLEGSVVRSGDRVRITAQLIQAQKDRHIWAHSYERDLRNVFTLQGEIARDIVGEVRANSRPTPSARPVNPESYEAYLRGRHDLNNATSEAELETSISNFQLAITKDLQSGTESLAARSELLHLSHLHCALRGAEGTIQGGHTGN